MIIILIFLPLLLYFALGNIEFYIFGAQQQSAEHIKNYYLERVCVEGYLTQEDEKDMIKKFDKKAMTVNDIDAPRESQGHPRILRDNSDPYSSEVWLTVDAKPKEDLFVFGKLLGSNSPENPLISVGGRRLSERIDP